MSKDLYMKNFNGDKIFSLEYDKETLRDMVLDNQEEIERLNNIINELEKYLIGNEITVYNIGGRVGVMRSDILYKLQELKRR